MMAVVTAGRYPLRAAGALSPLGQHGLTVEAVLDIGEPEQALAGPAAGGPRPRR